MREVRRYSHTVFAVSFPPHPCCFGNEMTRFNPKNRPSPPSLVAQRVGFESPFFLLAFSCVGDSVHGHDQEY